MKKIFVIYLIAVLSSGCIGGPLKKWFSIQKQEVKTEQKIDVNKEQTVEKAKGTVWATDYSLSKDPAPNIFSVTAKDLNLRTQSIVGTPPLEVIKEYQKIVDGLVSTNELLRIDAKRSLDKKDVEISGLQSELTKLNGKLSQIQEEKNKLGLENSKLANTWSTIKKWFWIIVWVIIIGVVLAVISQILSVALPPPYNGIFSIVALVVGGIGKMLFKLV
ncbi:MAG: hypothetical protein AABY22_25470, partial [Nanoarchaeota archaeon]